MSEHIARSGECQVFHYHRRGYANSSPALGPQSMAEEAMDAGAVIRAMQAAPAHVVGVSYSAAVALTLASSEPELVQTLAVVEAPPVGTPGASEFREANQHLLRSHNSSGAQVALDQFMTLLVGRNWREDSERDLPGSVAAMERDAARFFESDIPALLSWRFDATEAARVRCPVLYVGGSESGPWFTQMRTRLLHLLSGAAAATVDGAGHLLASTHPAEVAALLLEHFRRYPRAVVA